MGFGLRGPKLRVCGLAFAGEVEAIGIDVRDLQAGDRVYGAAAGALAEFVRAPRAAVARVPSASGSRGPRPSRIRQ
ncbi:alcohol dehydrogenase catalytic domain-containing protein [Leifsonia sp. McL0607]|uniref:alcohol dehydrogenase catalytic domain-containing protein n=1 Tax=Leifsonia sp. McL0607 TaxID=3415672 RepID=UPI003CF3B45E